MPLKLERREIIGHMKKFVISAEEILDLKDDLESRIVERAKGSGLRPTSVQDARLALELKKKEHKKLWNDIGKKYYPFLMDIQFPHLQREHATHVRKPPVARATPVRTGVTRNTAEPGHQRPPPQSEPEPEPEPVKSRSRRSCLGKSSSCWGRARMKNKQTKRRNKKQTKKYKRMR